MRQLTSSEIDKLKVLTENSVELTLIEPTGTGLAKSIMDATATVRLYLLNSGIHDFTNQLQGQDHKILLDAKLIDNNEVINSKVSLYRPETKNGDPRIWFKGLPSYCKANDILAIICFKGVVSVVNITRLNIKQLVEGKSNPLKELVEEINRIENSVAEELLLKLKKIAAAGYVKALLSADTAVGRTLESLLGIDINSSKKPDYKGIELKSFREKRTNRKNLFAQVPDWNESKFKSSEEILDNFGYKRLNDFKLYCTVSTITRNSQGLQLCIDSKKGKLFENSNRIGDFVTWGLDVLHDRLLEKHNETFWIAAESFWDDGKEFFQYKKVEHTKKPISSQFDILLEQGIITLDHLIKKTPNGKVVEKGPLFKIKPNAVGLLFPPSKTYDLKC